MLWGVCQLFTPLGQKDTLFLEGTERRNIVMNDEGREPSQGLGRVSPLSGGSLPVLNKRPLFKSGMGGTYVNLFLTKERKLPILGKQRSNVT